MDKSCQEIIQEILIKAQSEGKKLSEHQLIKILDRIPGFWEQARDEEEPLQDETHTTN